MRPPMLAVSPHLDDAILAVGGLLAANQGSVMVTVLAGVPSGGGQVTDFDSRCGFASSTEAVACRREEDKAAAATVGAVGVEHLRFLDGQYGHPAPRHKVAAAILRLARDYQPLILLGPLGLRHPDHLLVGDMFLLAAKRVDAEVWVYEDLPYRVEHPESVVDRLAAVRSRGWRAELVHEGGPPGADKQAAVAEYASQAPLLPPWAALVPERAWRLRRVG